MTTAAEPRCESTSATVHSGRVRLGAKLIGIEAIDDRVESGQRCAQRVELVHHAVVRRLFPQITNCVRRVRCARSTPAVDASCSIARKRSL